MGDLGWTSQAAQLRRELKGAAALIARRLSQVLFWSFVTAVVVMIAGCIVGWFLSGATLIIAAVLVIGRYVDDPAPGLRAVLTVGLALLFGAIGSVITGQAIWVVVSMTRAAWRWTRAQRVARLRRVVG